MAPQTTLNTQDITDKARRGILQQLESVGDRSLTSASRRTIVIDYLQVRGKKNLVIQRDLLGPIGLIIKFSTLQEYGVDKLFILENKNAETSQKNVVFLARGEKPHQVQAIAGRHR